MGRVLEEHPEEAHSAQLDAEAELGMGYPPLADPLAVGVVKEEDPLQLCPLRRSGEFAVGAGRLIG